METGVNKLLEGTGEAIKTVPELYDDGLKPAVQESGKTLSLLPKTINAALVPLRKWIAEREYSLAETEKLLEIKLRNIDYNKIVTPEAYVAVPALQAISYSMDSEELRNMYANLLAKAMNVDEKDKVHPAFVELIKQMAPREALILDGIFKSPITPLIDLSVRTDKGNDNYIYNISWITCFSYDDIAVALDNLERMGLIEIPFGERYVDDQAYNPIRNTSVYKEQRKKLENMNIGKIEETKKHIKKTALANSFYEVCLKEKWCSRKLLFDGGMVNV